MTFTVRTKRWGSDGGGGVNVEVVTVSPQQETLDLPIDTADVEASRLAAGADDDKIPF